MKFSKKMMLIYLYIGISMLSYTLTWNIIKNIFLSQVESIERIIAQKEYKTKKNSN